MERFDCAVIGAGVVGLAVARRLARAGRRVVVFEAEADVGGHASSHNSGVIHAGVYYPRGSLKARLCVAGRRALYAFAAAHDVPHRRVGKLMIAVEEAEVPTLERIARLGAANGVDDLVALSGAEVRALEPALNAVRAVWSPSTGIIDPIALMAALRAELEAHGGRVVRSTPVTGGEVSADAIALETSTGRLECHAVVNAAGHHAPRVATSLKGLAARFVPSAYYARGHYVSVVGPAPVERLVYPMPSPGVPHIHLSLTLSGRARLGPDTSWSEAPDYAFDATRLEGFSRAVRRYVPDLGRLQADGVGIRSKIVPEGVPAADFAIQGPEVHGVAGLVNLFGIESPGLTACLAIADEVSARLDGA